ncbi:MAG: biosynthetic arginine decarboxylase, partial [Bacteroidota bacterium]
SLVEALEAQGTTEAFKLLHIHIGSQIPDVRTLRDAVKELTQVYVQLRRRGIGIERMDVGGGLGVSYTVGYSASSGTDSGDAINYSLDEYANAVVYTVQEVCDAAGCLHPDLVSESGRALTAHHSVLLVNVQGAYGRDAIDPAFVPAEDDHAVVRDLYQTLSWIREPETTQPPALLEAYHDLAEKRREADALFTYGYLDLEQKALAERLFWSACRHIHTRIGETDPEWLPAELQALDDLLIDQYLCDFSVFQSMIDHWAIGQRFPIVPIHRLDEVPSRRGVLVDLTCDSDGKISRFVSPDPEKDYLELHPLRPGEPYVLGVFLMGAYQDIMGDMHNLFGRVGEAHVYADADEPQGYYVEKTVAGASVQDILALVRYFPNDLQRRMSELVRAKVKAKTIRSAAGYHLLNEYKQLFEETTYLGG